MANYQDVYVWHDVATYDPKRVKEFRCHVIVLLDTVVFGSFEVASCSLHGLSVMGVTHYKIFTQA